MVVGLVIVGLEIVGLEIVGQVAVGQVAVGHVACRSCGVSVKWRVGQVAVGQVAVGHVAVGQVSATRFFGILEKFLKKTKGGPFENYCPSTNQFRSGHP